MSIEGLEQAAWSPCTFRQISPGAEMALSCPGEVNLYLSQVSKFSCLFCDLQSQSKCFTDFQGDVHPPHDDDRADGALLVCQPHPCRNARAPHPRLCRHFPRGEGATRT